MTNEKEKETNPIFNRCSNKIFRITKKTPSLIADLEIPNKDSINFITRNYRFNIGRGTCNEASLVTGIEGDFKIKYTINKTGALVVISIPRNGEMKNPILTEENLTFNDGYLNLSQYGLEVIREFDGYLGNLYDKYKIDRQLTERLNHSLFEEDNRRDCDFNSIPSDANQHNYITARDTLDKLIIIGKSIFEYPTHKDIFKEIEQKYGELKECRGGYVKRFSDFDFRFYGSPEEYPPAEHDLITLMLNKEICERMRYFMAQEF